MNGELVPALVAAGGGTALLAGIYAHEARRDARMRSGRVRYRLLFPLGVTEQAGTVALAGLVGATEASEFVLEVTADEKGVAHAVSVPADRTEATVRHLEAAIPGLRCEKADPVDAGLSVMALRVFVPTRTLLRSKDAAVAGRGLLGTLGRLAAGERVTFRWAARPARGRVSDRPATTAAERDLDLALRRRATEPGFAVGGLVLVGAASGGRARQLIDGVGQAVRARHAQGPPLRLTYERSGRRLSSAPKASLRGGRITSAELLGLIGWPLGDELIAGVSLGVARQLPAPREMPREGRRLLVGQGRGGERPVALSAQAQTLHQVVLGPTGSGKSTVLARAALDDVACGHAGLVVDPKDGSLVQAIIDRVGPEAAGRVVVLDPGAAAVVGLDLFGHGDPHLRAEVLTSTLRSIYAPLGAWGVRSDTYVALALRTIAVLERPSLALVGRLFTDAAFRRQAVAAVDDPLQQAAWASYDDLSAPEQREHVAAPLNRIMGLLQRPAVRAILGQPAPKLQLEELWQRRGWLVVNLAPGVLGEGAARLVGAVLSFLAWSALEARAGQPRANVPTTLVFDELQALADLPTSLERLAERARGFNGRLVVGSQVASRLPASLVDAVLGNFATVMTFRCSAREAERIARELPGLEARDLIHLAPYEVAARVATGTGTGVVTVTGRTEPLPPVTGQAARIRALSAERYGTPRSQLDAAFRELLSRPPAPGGRPDPGRTRRAS
jgi:hypothetical protein